MKFKMFSAEGPDGIVKAVNAWLSQESRIEVRHTETKPVLSGPENTVSGLLFSLWYDQDDK
jgi:hypothetical protein